MTVTMDRTYGGKVEVLDVERRRRWTGDEKARMVEETYAPGATVSAVARRNGVSPSLLFRWRGLAQQGSLTSVRADEPVVPASHYTALEKQVKELQRLLGKKTMENEILREACEVAQAKKYISRAPLLPRGDTP